MTCCSILKKECTPLSFFLPKSSVVMAAGESQIPSASNILYLPYSFLSTLSSLIKSRAIGDVEGEIDAHIRLSGMPVSLLHSLLSFSTTAIEITNSITSISGSKAICAALLLPMSITGIALCGIEALFEGNALKREYDFLQQITPSLEEQLRELQKADSPEKIEELLQNSLTALRQKVESCQDPERKKVVQTLATQLENALTSPGIMPVQAQTFLSKIQRAELQESLSHLQEEFLQLSPTEIEKIKHLTKIKLPRGASPQELKDKESTLSEQFLEVKYNNLARRVQPWCADKVQKELRPILEKLRSADSTAQIEGQKQAEDLAKTLRTQGKKKLLSHIVALVAITISAVGFTALLIGCPFAFAGIVLAAASTIAIANYFYTKGTLDCEGWHFSFVNCIPEWIRYLYRKVCPISQAPTSLMPATKA